MSFSADMAAEIATSAAELASNAILHGRGGVLHISFEADRLIISVLDRGGGEARVIRDRIAGLRPAPSASATKPLGLGLGLGAVARLMSGISVITAGPNNNITKFFDDEAQARAWLAERIKLGAGG